MATYSQLKDPETQTRLNQRYQSEIAGLKRLGFHFLAYCLEDHGPYSALKHPLISLFAMSKSEIMKFKWPFRVALANVLMAAENPPTIALCMGLGVKFYTPYQNGTVLITSNFHSGMSFGPDSRIIRNAQISSLDEAWEEHRRMALELSGQVEFLSDRMVFGDYVMLSALEEEAAKFTSTF